MSQLVAEAYSSIIKSFGLTSLTNPIQPSVTACVPDVLVIDEPRASTDPS